MRAYDEESEAFHLSYGQLEDMLFGLHDASTHEARSIIVSRYKNLQKLGIPAGSRPAQGKRQKYTLVQVCEWVMAFQLLECGVDQRIVVEILSLQPSSKKGRITHPDIIRLAGLVVLAVGEDLAAGYRDWIYAFPALFLTSRWEQNDNHDGYVRHESELKSLMKTESRLLIIGFSTLANWMGHFYRERGFPNVDHS